MPAVNGKTAGAISSAAAGVNLRIDTGTLSNLGVPVNYVGELTNGVLTVPQMPRLTWHITRLGGTTPVEIVPRIAYRRVTPVGGNKYDLEFLTALPPVAFPAVGPAVLTLNTAVAEAISITLAIPNNVPVPDPNNRFLIFLSGTA